MFDDIFDTIPNKAGTPVTTAFKNITSKAVSSDFTGGAGRTGSIRRVLQKPDDRRYSNLIKNFIRKSSD